MILDKYKPKEIVLENTNILTENIIKLNTYVNNINNTGTVNELYQFIDNTISYFIGKKSLLRNQVQNDIGKLTSLKTQLKKKCSDNINITLSVPNNIFYRIPEINFLYTDSILTQWNCVDNSKNYLYANIYSILYMPVVKKMTEGKMKSINHIDKEFMKQCTTKKTITNKNDFIKTINNFQFPMDDINKIYKLIDFFISQLKQLHNMSLLDVVPKDTPDSMVIPLCIRMVDMKTMYIKSIINIILMFYTKKLESFNIYSISENTLFEDIADNLLYNRQYETESLSILESGINFDNINKISEAYNYINVAMITDLKYIVDSYYNKAMNKLLNDKSNFGTDTLTVRYNELNYKLEEFKNTHTNNLNVSTFYDKPFKYMSMEVMGSIDELINYLFNKYDIFIDTSRLIQDKYYFKLIDCINKNSPNYKEIINIVNRVRDLAKEYNNISTIEEPPTDIYNTTELDKYGNKKSNRYIDIDIYDLVKNFRLLCIDILNQ